MVPSYNLSVPNVKSSINPTSKPSEPPSITCNDNKGNIKFQDSFLSCEDIANRYNSIKLCSRKRIETFCKKTCRIINLLPGTAPHVRVPDSPQFLSLNWLTRVDEYIICLTDDSLKQRYALAVFYFSTNGDTWKTCGRKTNICHPKLKLFDDDPEISIWSNNTWLSKGNTCEWGGLACRKKGQHEIVLDRIDFDTNNITGTIPEEIKYLTDLRYFTIEGAKNATDYDNGVMALGGSIPAQIGFLKSLIYIDLNFNYLTGNIPTELFSLTKIRALDLNDNNLIGSIDSRIGNLSQLILLQMDNNQLTSTIPTEIGKLEKLRYASFGGNNFTGSIPFFWK